MNDAKMHLTMVSNMSWSIQLLWLKQASQSKTKEDNKEISSYQALIYKCWMNQGFSDSRKKQYISEILISYKHSNVQLNIW